MRRFSIGPITSPPAGSIGTLPKSPSEPTNWKVAKLRPKVYGDRNEFEQHVTVDLGVLIIEARCSRPADGANLRRVCCGWIAQTKECTDEPIRILLHLLASESDWESSHRTAIG